MRDATYEQRGIAMTRAEIAEAEGITLEGVRLSLASGLRKLRRRYPAILTEMAEMADELSANRHTEHGICFFPDGNRARRAGAE